MQGKTSHKKMLETLMKICFRGNTLYSEDSGDKDKSKWHRVLLEALKTAMLTTGGRFLTYFTKLSEIEMSRRRLIII